MQISDIAVDKIRGNNVIKGMLCSAFDRHMKTIEDWLEEKNIMLTTPTAVEIIKRETGLDDKKILVQEKK